jgi:hypothetical protein
LGQWIDNISSPVKNIRNQEAILPDTGAESIGKHSVVRSIGIARNRIVGYIVSLDAY